MKLKETFRAAAVAIPLMAAGCSGCDSKPSQADCDEVAESSRPVDGACLHNSFDSVEAYRVACAGIVTTTMMECSSGETEAPVWVCRTTPKPTGSAM
jgi:hypothetical protein